MYVSLLPRSVHHNDKDCYYFLLYHKSLYRLFVLEKHFGTVLLGVLTMVFVNQHLKQYCLSKFKTKSHADFSTMMPDSINTG